MALMRRAFCVITAEFSIYLNNVIGFFWSDISSLFLLLLFIIIKSYTKYRIQRENEQSKKPTGSCKRAR